MTNLRKYMNLMESSDLTEDSLEQTLDKAVSILNAEKTDGNIEEGSINGFVGIAAGGYLLSAAIVLALLKMYGADGASIAKIIQTTSSLGMVFTFAGLTADQASGWKVSNLIGNNIDKIVNVIKKIGGSPKTVHDAEEVLNYLDQRASGNVDPTRSRRSLRNRNESLEEAESQGITADSLKDLISSGRLKLTLSLDKEPGMYGDTPGVKAIAVLYLDDTLIVMDDDYVSVESL